LKPGDARVVVAVDQARRDRLQARRGRGGEQFAERRLPSQKKISSVGLVIKCPKNPLLVGPMPPDAVRSGRHADLVEVVARQVWDAVAQHVQRERLAGGA
jgi:hypothetical protein